MSEHITHVAVYEDCTRLMLADKEKFPASFSYSLDKSYDSGLTCSGARGNHLFAITILEKYMKKKPTELDLKASEQIAGAIGWLTHRAADLQMKPIFRMVGEYDNPVLTYDECQMFHDAVIFKEVYKGGTVSSGSAYEVFSEATLAKGMKSNKVSELLDAELAENIFTHYYMAELLDQQNINLDADISNVVDEMINASQDIYEDLLIYIEAFQNPDPVKMMGYIHNFNIYDKNDALIKIVRDIQFNNKFPEPEELNKAFSTHHSQSQYAQALKRAYDYLIAAGKFYSGLLDKESVYDAVENYTKEHRI